MFLLSNPLRFDGLPARANVAQGTVVADAGAARRLFERCPEAKATPLRTSAAVADALGIATFYVKDESQRLGLGSFKALGAAHAIAREAAQRLEREGVPVEASALATALAGEVYACASAGNHGLSVAAGARLFGAKAVVYLGQAVPEAFAQRLRAHGAEVVRTGGDYEASMAVAAEQAEQHGWVLLSDSSWPGYVEWPLRVMEGYLIMGDELVHQLSPMPTHVFLQAGVGGFAAAMTALMRARWGEGPIIVVVEPENAPALMNSIRAASPVTVEGPVSVMGRMDCKAPSHVALGELAREADFFITITDAESLESLALFERLGFATTASGVAGFAAAHHAKAAERDTLGLDRDSRVLVFMTEGPERVL